MRFIILAAAPLLMASATLARSPLRRGPTTDTCANLDKDLVFSDVDGKPYNAGRVKAGLCDSQVQRFIGHYDVTEAASKVVGSDKVEAAVMNMINEEGVQCSYPLHAISSVSSTNECSFICTDGFTAMPATNHPSSCICLPPLTECNGKCGHFDLKCSTTPPPSRRKNDPKCAEHLTMCGVPDATWGQAYKCIDVTSDSYTCGGCVKASPFGGSSTGGVNCHDIPNVDEVSCINKECVVHTCKNGFTASASNDGCVPNPHGKSTRGLPPPLPDTPDIPDSIYLPLHVVLPDGITTIAGSVVDEVPHTD